MSIAGYSIKRAKTELREFLLAARITPGSNTIITLNGRALSADVLWELAELDAPTRDLIERISKLPDTTIAGCHDGREFTVSELRAMLLDGTFVLTKT